MIEENNLSEVLENNYFVGVKFGYSLLMIICVILQSDNTIVESSRIFILAAVCASIMGIYEVTEHKKILLTAELITIFCGVFFLGNEFILLLPVAVSDIVVTFNLPFFMWLSPAVCVIFSSDKFIFIFLCLMTIIIYFQHYGIIMKYRKSTQHYEQQELTLKDSIYYNTQKFKHEIRRTNLYYENMILQNKMKLSQELHDKLGHRINGSIYQLEACRAISSSNPEKSDEILERVIDSLRTGMDDIRILLRRERPDGRRLALLQLTSLCDDCRHQYGIDAQLNITGPSEKIEEQIWNVLLDNCCESITNALKYSKCSKIMIDIHVLNKVLRCCIRDNGKGCENISEGMGIQGMKMRISNLGGTIDFDGNNGFIINMLIPISETGGLTNGN